MQIEMPREPITGYTPFALGFRPFFLAAGILAVVIFPIWLAILWQGGTVSGYYPDDISWHRHEMLFGFTMAVIAGFLLTAVKNWTNRDTPSGLPLAAIFLLWLAARVAPLTESPALLTALTDTLFAPLVAIVIAVPILRSRQTNNLIFPFILLLIGAANLAIHLELLGITQRSRSPAEQVAPLLMLWVLVIMAGRVIPFFIERATQGFQRRSWKSVEVLSSASLVALMISLLVAPEFSGILALLAAVVHLIRVTGWYTHQLWREPLIWVLWLGYLWLVIGLLLHGLAHYGVFPLNSAVHAYFVGAIGVLTLGMMARVAIGHSGREMRLPHSAMAYAFAMINIAALSRVFATSLPLDYTWSLGIAGIMWCGGFMIFVWFYTPILLKARVDGRPG